MKIVKMTGIALNQLASQTPKTLMCAMLVHTTWFMSLLLAACQPLQVPTASTATANTVATITTDAQVGRRGETIAFQPPATTTLAQFDRLELRLDADFAVENPYNPTQANILVHFTSPDGEEMTVPAFWMQPYDRATEQPNGDAGWRVRFTPPVAGVWQAQVEIVNVAARSEPFAFTVTPSDNPGFIRIHPENPRYFAFDDGSFYFPNGLNIGWSVGDVLADYERWFDQLSANQGNVARVWMASWSFGIEWEDTGLGNYDARMKEAWLLDQVFAMAEERDIYIMLCLINHGAFSTSVNPEWDKNPYNAALGGPLTTPIDFVTDPVAKAFFQQRLRYIAARWGYSTHLYAWEWWNEVNWTGISDDILIPWFEEMTPALQQYDPYDHLITNSSANGGFTQVWAMPEIDFSQQHDYTGGDLLQTMARDFARITKIAPDQPLLMSELGYSAGAQGALDTLHLHTGLWGAPFLGYAGGSLYWWWDTFVDPQDQWYQYGALGRFFAGEDLATLSPNEAEVAGEALALTLQNEERVLVWLRSDQYSVAAAQAAYDKAVLDAIKSKTKLTEWSYEPPLLQDIVVTLHDLANGTYVVQWYAPTTGEWLGQEQIDVTDRTATIVAPNFATDLALKLNRSP